MRKLVEKYNRDLITLDIGFNNIDNKTVNAIKAVCDKNKEVIAAGAFARNCPGLLGVFKRPYVLRRTSNFDGAFEWARRALNSQKRRFPARAVKKGGAKVEAAEATRLLASITEEQKLEYRTAFDKFDSSGAPPLAHGDTVIANFRSK